MVTPKYLKKGDTLAIVSTARKITAHELEPAIELLTSWGLKVVLGNTIGATENQFAGSDKLRLQDFQEQIDNPEIKAIWCARGGYGTVRIIDKLDFTAFTRNPKWILGYSDVTTLHSHIHNLGIETLHALMAGEVKGKKESLVDGLKQTLFGKEQSITYTPNDKLNRIGKTTGRLIGGNLSILYSHCGSPSAINTENTILFIEDLDEYLYHLDRMMQNLKRNGMLAKLSGLVVGGMNDMNDNTIPFGKTAKEIIYDAVADYTYPVCFDFPAGHVNENNTLILGRKCELVVSKTNVTLKFNS
jgi:muramoyltetrapeptide carboxypeptidase